MRRSVTISVYNRGGQVLAVTNRRWGGFTLPGGKVEPGEDTEMAAWRELEEETGIVSDALKYLGSSLFDNPFTEDAPFLVSHFEAVVENPHAIQMEDGTVPSWKQPVKFFEDKQSIFREHYKRVSALGILKPWVM